MAWSDRISSWKERRLKAPPPLTTEEVLREEAEAVHQADLAGVQKDELYRALNGLNSAALCLSGGGIRSAAFALGVIQALAAHPRLPDGNPVAAAEQSLLRKFHYLSTVSGGGYIGSWLSAWLARAGFDTVWRNLVGRPDGPDSEPASIGWLRSYSNYLTPELGLMSADTWAILAVYLRNLVLNWLVILPAICAAILLLKVLVVGLIGLSNINHAVQPRLLVAMLGIGFLLVALSFTTRNRPSRREGAPDQTAASPTRTPTAPSLGQPDLVAALGDRVHAVSRHHQHDHRRGRHAALQLSEIHGRRVRHPGRRTGLCACLDVAAAVSRLSGEGRKHDWSDFALWTSSGLVYGALVGLGFYFYLLVPNDSEHAAHRNPQQPGDVSHRRRALDPVAQWAADMVFVGLTSYQQQFNADQEWFARAAGGAVTAVGWTLGMFVAFAGFLPGIGSTSSAYFIMRFGWCRSSASGSRRRAGRHQQPVPLQFRAGRASSRQS